MRLQSTRIPARLAVVLLLGGSFTWFVFASSQDTASRKSPPTEFYAHHDHIIGTSLDLLMTAPDEAAAEAAERAILDEIERLRRIFSTYDPQSEISRLNQTSGPMLVSPEMIEVLGHYTIGQERSHGAFSGQLGELVRVWKEAEKSQREPDGATVSRIVHQIRQPGWRIDESTRTVTRLTDQPLNLNSIAKGYIIQKAAAAARAKSPTLQGLLLNLGGDMSVWGKDEAGRSAWPIGVQDPLHPEDNAAPLAQVRLQDRAIATSGGYERYYTINGKRYSHLFDARTGWSAEGVASATVIAKENVTANALATTLCVLAPEEGLRLALATPGVECLLVTKEGKQLRSPGFQAMEIPVAPREVPVALQAKDKKTEPWPEGFQVNFNITIPNVSSNRYRRPYLAIWVEDANAKPFRTITIWGSPSYWKDLPMWWKFARNNQDPLKDVTRATRPPGKYQVVWDGKDDSGTGVPRGMYTFRIEIHREHGKLTRQSGKIMCGNDPAKITLEKNAEIGDTIIEYAKKKAS